MKKLFILLIGLIIVCVPVFAEENDTQLVEQKVNNNQTYFTANLQKQPDSKQKQGISNSFTFFTINIQINGKIKDTNTTKE